MRLPVGGSTPPDPSVRRDLSNTFGQLSSPNPTPIRRRLHLPRIGGRNSDGNIRAMMRSLRAHAQLLTNTAALAFTTGELTSRMGVADATPR